MSDSESIKKMLRSVLQSSKNGVSISSLQSEYRSLCGEIIPLKKLGYSNLENYLRSIPSVVRLEYFMGEVRCFAAVCEETAHIAELVAKQKSSKKSGRSQVVNCRMRFKRSNPYMLNVAPRLSLRQPSAAGASYWTANRSWSPGSYRNFSNAGDYRQYNQKLNIPVEHRKPASQLGNKKNSANCQTAKEKLPEQVSNPKHSEPGVYSAELVQGRLTKLLEKYYSGLWMSKLSQVYGDMFGEKLHPQALTDLEKWTHICMVEKPSSNLRADRLIYPPLPSPVPKSSPTPLTIPNTSNDMTTPVSSEVMKSGQPSTKLSPLPVPKPQVAPKSPSAEPILSSPQQSIATSPSTPLSSASACSPPGGLQLPPITNLAVGTNGGCEDAATVLNHKGHKVVKSGHLPDPNFAHPATAKAPSQALSLQPGTDVLPLRKATFSPTSSSSAPCHPSKPSTPCTVVVEEEMHEKIKEILSKHSWGLWAPALPKLFTDTYKTPFPEHIMDNLSLLLDICRVEYPMPHDKKKAILYYSNRTNMEATQGHDSRPPGHYLPSGVEVVSPVMPSFLVLPSEQYPSVLITEAKGSNAVTIRYVGENYSNAQEAMEETMHDFYGQRSTHHHPSSLVVGQLVAVRAEEGDELARAQVVELMTPNTVKVYYVDYGFSALTSVLNLLELQLDFLFFPFQATNVKLAGLEMFSSHPAVQASLDTLVVGKILLMETLEALQQNETPVVVLYDTSQEEDVNINSTCLKALQDKTMNNPLTVNATYEDVRVTNVSPEGVLYCQLPSRGAARLCKSLEETEAIFTTQVTSDSLVSRPFSGKLCLAQYQGKWSRVEISNMHGNRVMEILFIDLGIPATVEVTDLREMPPALIQDLTVIPPQATKCHLAELAVPKGDWNPEAVLWVKEAVLSSRNCKLKVWKLEQLKEDWLIYVYLFIGTDSQDLDKSINRQLAQSELWNKLITENDINSDGKTDLSAENMTESSSVTNQMIRASTRPVSGTDDSCSATKCEMQPRLLPPPLELPQPGQNIDVFVPVACHPGHFVLQQWQELHKLMVLMGEMILHYNRTWKVNTVPHIEKGEIYAAKIDENWHRVQVKGILANGFVSVYKLDHGRHELVNRTLLQSLIEEFRQLPFQAVIAQLAGVTQCQWSEEASMLFRNHVEDRALVAKVESAQECSEVKGEPWERKLTVYLVDTALEDRDLWIHNIMANIGGGQSSAA